MQTHHSLALPLSAAYTHDSREGFAFFHCTTTDETKGDTLLHPTLERYLDDLCGFLRDARLIQSHPDNYFQFMRGETWEASAVHFDGSPVEAKELAETRRLLSCFGSLLRGDDAMMKLRTLVRDGPPPCNPTWPFTSATLLNTPQENTHAHPDEPPTPLQALSAFYTRTRQLMLGRARRPKNDAATFTLLSPVACAALDRTSTAAVAAREHKQHILDLVVSHGMNPKKQHEVRIMRDTMHDLLESCNTGIGGEVKGRRKNAGNDRLILNGEVGSKVGTPLPSTERVDTVINIGEGKGYVSRAVALCDNAQVVGLDCNPAHKERAVERIESLLEASLSSRNGRPRVNLLYEPRGHVASIACRVEECVNWTTLLKGHVLTCDDARCDCGTANAAAANSAAGVSEYHNASTHGSNDTYADALTPLSRTRGEESVKLSCRLCGKVVRLENTTVIIKHVYAHLNEAKNSASTSSLVPSAEQLCQWNLSLSQHAYTAKLTETFFSVTDVDVRHHDNSKNAVLLKRPRDADTSEEADSGDVTGKHAAELGCLTLQRVSSSYSSEATIGSGDEESENKQSTTQREGSFVTVQPTNVARGYRAVLLMARAVCPVPSKSSETPLYNPQSKTTEALKDNEEVNREDVSNKQDRSLLEQPATPTWRYEQQIATIVGYDGGVECHQVFLDVESKKRVLHLYRLPPSANSVSSSPSLRLNVSNSVSSASNSACVSAAAMCSSFIGDLRLPDAAIWGRKHLALVLSVLPPALPSTPVVCVPSIRNTVLTGLHPCGDLGSNVCRIFCNSAARGLLLVSCCWHALTPKGFPLSRAIRRRGMTTDSVSLLLATQPLDAWSTASPEGHRSSAKLLFYRSLFKLLWARLAREWSQDQQQHVLQEKSDLCTHKECEFPAAPPHLEPAFLRSMSRRKETLTFVEFVEAIAAYYLYRGTAKDTPYTLWNTGHRCATCRDAQESFVRTALTLRGLPKEMATLFEREHFASFLGLTVLRMWMCHLVESLLLLDRTLYLHEELSACGDGVDRNHKKREDSAVSLVPLFDGALSPRMYGVLARRGGSA